MKSRQNKLKNVKLGLVASSGGHLFELNSLKKFWGKQKRFWVSFPTEDAKCILKREKVYWAFFPTNRNALNLLKNIVLAFKILLKEKPDIILSTGAGVAVPFLLVGKILRSRTLYLELITRSRELSLTAYLVYPFVDKLLVQWPELASKYKKAEFRGRII